MFAKVYGLPVGVKKQQVAEAALQCGAEVVEFHFHGENGINVVCRVETEQQLKALSETLRARAEGLPKRWAPVTRKTSRVVNITVKPAGGKPWGVPANLIYAAVRGELEACCVEWRSMCYVPKRKFLMVELKDASDAPLLTGWGSGVVDALEVQRGKSRVFLYGDQCQQRKNHIFTSGIRNENASSGLSSLGSNRSIGNASEWTTGSISGLTGSSDDITSESGSIESMVGAQGSGLTVLPPAPLDAGCEEDECLQMLAAGCGFDYALHAAMYCW